MLGKKARQQDGSGPRTRLPGKRAGAVAVLVGLWSTPVAPQAGDALPGADFYLDLSSGLVVSDNFDRVVAPSGTTTLLRNSVELGYESITQRERIGLFAGTDYDLGDFPDDPTGSDEGFNNPFASILYGRTTRNDEVTFRASYAENDVSTGNRLEDDLVDDNTDLSASTGRRQDTRASLDFTIANDAPLGARGRIDYAGRRFLDVDDPDLEDRDVYSGELFLRFAPTRSTQVSVGGRYEERQTDDEADTVETDSSFGIGITHRTAGNTVLEASAGAARNREEATRADGSRASDESVRPVFGLAAERDLRDGSLRLSLDQALTDEGLRSELQFGRNRGFRVSSLAWRLGVSVNDTEGANAIGAVTYVRETPQGTFSIDLTQRVLTDTDDGDILRTDLGLGWNRSLTELSSLSLDLSLSRSEAFDEDITDRSRLRGELAYRYTLTEDWNLNTGYRYFVSTRTDREDIVENEVFANVSRRFNLRP